MNSIEDMKLLLANNSVKEFADALCKYDMSEKDKFGNNILHYFIKLCDNSMPSKSTKDWKTVIDILMEHGANIEEKQTKGNGCSPLHLAVLCHQKDITEYLILLGADVNSTNSRGMPILFTAIMSNALTSLDWFIEKLLKSGANSDFELPDGQTIKNVALGISNRDYSKFFI